ncbi:MAG: molybdopterin-dependent oxidoreductase [Spirochaetes bacterium]|nr:molybdopterin-dependent oxidoreductase [Spirochaetota bacterium]
MKPESLNIKKDEIWEDVWINTQCHRCQSECGLRAHRVNGVVVKLEGNPNSSIGSGGGLCPKGMAGLQVLYDPNRLNVPLKRSNPEKGIGVDPKWVEISWDEALEKITGKLKKTFDEDPSGIVIQHGIVAGNQIVPYYLVPMLACLSNEKGHPTHNNSAGAHCGNAGHFVNALNYASFVVMPDFNYCNYEIVFGTNSGNGGFQQYASMLGAQARARGMKLIVFDPVCNNAASKADEWIPIIPGTDGIVCLAMLNVIVNELGIIDEPYLKIKTNASYLIGPDGHYVRDKETNKPMIWDGKASKAKTFDHPAIGEIELNGSYEIQGIKCRPAWVLLKERFKEYTPENASPVSGVPAETIRRIATEYAQAAKIGSTITIEGHELPFRPVSTFNIRSAGTHKNGTQTLFAMDLLNHVVGAVAVPGGCATISMECHGYPETNQPRLVAASCPDGLLRTGGKWLFPEGGPWPLREPQSPKHDLAEVFPCALEVPMVNMVDREEVLKKTGLYHKHDVLINYASNAAMNGTDPRIREKFYKAIPFIVDIDIFSNEFNEAFADILLPSAFYLELSDWMGVQHTYHNQPPGLDFPWCCHITQAVVEPMYQRRNAAQIVIEILTRMGLGPKLNMVFNGVFGLDEKRKLKPDDKIVWEDLCNRAVVSVFGEEHNWEWFKKNGFISWPKKIEEVYWGHFRNNIRHQVYWEFMVNARKRVEAITKEIGLEGYLDILQYDPLPMWVPIPAHEVEDKSFDLYAFSWGDAMHGNTNCHEQPWIDEVSKMNPFTYYVNINEATAKAKGLQAGDLVEIESWRGQKVKGVIQTRKAQHPDTLTVMGVSGHWAKGQPIAKGKGVNFNSLIDFRFSDMDPISGSTEVCVKVKVKKIK